MKLNALITRIEFFQKWAQENLDTSIEETNLSPQEKQKIYQQRHREKIKELGKTNPSDPMYQTYLAGIKRRYDLKQERLESNPSALQHDLNINLLKQQKWRESKTPEERRAYKEKYRAAEWERKKNLIKEDSLDGKLALLRSQVAWRKRDIIKKITNPEALQHYETICGKIGDFVHEVTEYLYGIHHANSSYVAKPEQLYSLITKAQSIVPVVDQLRSLSINDTFTQVINKMQEHADTLTQR